jgi:hypothetical protein
VNLAFGYEFTCTCGRDFIITEEQARGNGITKCPKCRKKRDPSKDGGTIGFLIRIEENEKGKTIYKRI